MQFQNFMADRWGNKGNSGRLYFPGVFQEKKKKKGFNFMSPDEATNLYLAYQKFILIYISLKMNVYKIS